MVRVNRRNEDGGSGVDQCSVKSSIIREMGKDPISNFFQTFLEKFDRGSCNDGSRRLIPIFDYSHLSLN